MTNISFLMPAFNSVKYLGEAIESVMASMEDGDELVIQDGHSSDGTRELILEYAAKDKRILLVSERDSGQSDALNRGLARCTNDYLVWINADDLVYADGVASLRAEADRDSSIEVIVGGHSIIHANGAEVSRYQGEALSHERLMAKGCYVFSGAMLLNTAAVRRLGGFSRDYHYSMDLDLMFRLCDLKAAVLRNTIVASLRWHSDSKSGGSGHKFVRDAWRVRTFHLRGPRDSVRSIRAAAIQIAALATVPVRHSSLYARLRGHR